MYETVFIPTSGADGTEVAIEHAVDLAAQYDATLHTQYVIESVQMNDAIEEFTETEIYDRLEDAGQRALDTVVDAASEAGIDSVESSITQGLPHEEILDYIDDNDVDLVVMGTAGRTGEAREMIGSVTERVVHSSPVPVVVVNMNESR